MVLLFQISPLARRRRTADDSLPAAVAPHRFCLSTTAAVPSCRARSGCREGPAAAPRRSAPGRRGAAARRRPRRLARRPRRMGGATTRSRRSCCEPWPRTLAGASARTRPWRICACSPRSRSGPSSTRWVRATASDRAIERQMRPTARESTIHPSPPRSCALFRLFPRLSPLPLTVAPPPPICKPLHPCP